MVCEDEILKNTRTPFLVCEGDWWGEADHDKHDIKFFKIKNIFLVPLRKLIKIKEIF